MNVNRIVFALLALAAAGCRCDGGTKTGKPDFVALPTALDFSACPTKDEFNNPVEDGGVVPDEKRVKIDNRGTVPGTFSATLSGKDAARFSLDPARTPAMINGGADFELPVKFSPEKSGGAVATLTIDDGETDTPPLTVDLNGVGKNLPAQPTLEVSFEQYATPGTYERCVPGVLCRMGYPDTLLRDSTTLRIKLKNLGCPTLRVHKLDLVKANAGGNQMAFFLDRPSPPPSGDNKIEMSIADGTDEKILEVRFSPEGVEPPDTQRFAILTIESNDFTTPSYTLSLEGQGVVPALGPIPSFCNFNDLNDPCKRAPGVKEANKAEFTLVNDGSAPLKIDSAVFENGGRNGRFSIMTPIDNTMLMPGMSTILTVLHNDMPLFVIDKITVSASVPGMAAGTLGQVFLTVAGGTAPCLATEPDLTLSFLDPAMELTTQQITVKALATRPGTNPAQPCGNLIVDGVEIPTNPFFTLVDPMLAPGTVITAGQQAVINVQYKKPITGGRQANDITIKTNDLDYGAPSFKKLLLESEAPLNQLPQCVLKVCDARMTDCSMGSTTALMVRLSMLPTPKNITLWGGDSFDPPATSGGISEWKFQAIAPSPNVPGWRLPDAGVFTNQNYGTLTLDPSATGQYKTFLTVKDTSGQQSAMACQVNINVYQ